MSTSRRVMSGMESDCNATVDWQAHMRHVRGEAELLAVVEWFPVVPCDMTIRISDRSSEGSVDSDSRHRWRGIAFGFICAISAVLFFASIGVWICESALLWGWDMSVARMHFDQLGQTRYEVRCSGGGVLFAADASTFIASAPTHYIDRWRRGWAHDPTDPQGQEQQHDDV